MNCRFCSSELTEIFASLGASPLSNAYLTEERLSGMEPFYPLEARVCSACFLVQLPEFESPEEIFGDYAYFSSFSDSWLAHLKDYAGAMTERFSLGRDSLVVELASNDGATLGFFKDRGIGVLGIEPAANVAEVAVKKGVPTRVEFFSTESATALAKEGITADLLAGNNVLAHVPDLNGFVGGMKILLAPGGVITMEFPHLARLIEEVQFDTIYHEHFSYFSLATVIEVFAARGLKIFDVEEITTHGGSLRIFGAHAGDATKEISGNVASLLAREREAGLSELSTYLEFDEKVKALKRAFLRFLIDAREDGKAVAAYGAPAKGNTLLNYCGVGTDMIDYTVDKNPYKQGRYLPGSRIPVFGPEKLRETKPDYVVILPWNIKDEIIEQCDFVRSWGGRFVVPVPGVEVL